MGVDERNNSPVKGTQITSSQNMDNGVNQSNSDNTAKDMEITKNGDLVSKTLAESKSTLISGNNDKVGKITDKTDISKIWQNVKKGKETPKTTPLHINKPKTWVEGLALQEEREKLIE